MPRAIASTASVNSSREPWRATKSSSQGTTRTPATTIRPANTAALTSARRTSPKGPSRSDAMVGVGALPPSAGAIVGSRTRTTTVTRSWTMSQPMAAWPCGVSSSPRSVKGPQQDDGAGHRHGEPEDQPAAEPPAERDPQPDSEQRDHGDLAHGSRDGDVLDGQQLTDREVDPDPEHQEDHAELGELRGDARIRGEARGERSQEHAGDDVADDRGQPEAAGDEAADEGGRQAHGDRGDQNGLVVHGSSRCERGGAQDWRGSVPERRLVAGRGYPTDLRYGVAATVSTTSRGGCPALSRGRLDPVAGRRPEAESVGAVPVEEAGDVEIDPRARRQARRVRDGRAGRRGSGGPRDGRLRPGRARRGDRRAVHGRVRDPQLERGAPDRAGRQAADGHLQVAVAIETGSGVAVDEQPVRASVSGGRMGLVDVGVLGDREGRPASRPAAVRGRARPVIRERRARDRHERPVIRAGQKGQLEDAVGGPEPLAVRRVGQARPQRRTAGPHHELADAVSRVRPAPRVLRGEPLVVVVVAVQDQVGSRRVEQLPERADLRGRAVLAGAVERLMPVGEDVPAGVLPEVGPEPDALRRGTLAPADLGRSSRSGRRCARCPGRTRSSPCSSCRRRRRSTRSTAQRPRSGTRGSRPPAGSGPGTGPRSGRSSRGTGRPCHWDMRGLRGRRPCRAAPRPAWPWRSRR